MDTKPYRGSSAIPVTPFDERDRIDERALESVIEFIIGSGAQSICTPVMMSEFMSLDESERMLMMRLPAQIAAGRVKIIANCAGVSTAQAVRFAEYAKEHGADMLIAMAPYGAAHDFASIRAYFKSLSDATDLPIMIQNATLPYITLTPEQVVELCETIPRVSWVKQETIPGPQGIEQVTSLKASSLHGVMSGMAGLYSPTDYERGAIATIHACEFCDVMQRIWDLLFAGEEEKARDLQYALLPALQLEGLFGHLYVRDVLIRRGVLGPQHALPRGRTTGLSQRDKREIDRVWARTLPLLKVYTGG